MKTHNDPNITNLIAQSPAIAEAYDTTTPVFMEYAGAIDKWYKDQPISYAQIDEYAGTDPEKALGFRIALRFAESQRIIRSFMQPVTITLLNPVYKETGRMQPRNLHPHGEDSIRYKIEALRELEALNSNLTCRFVVIDDEDPDGSGHAAENILKEEYPEEFDNGKYRVLFLKQAIDQQDPCLPLGLTHKDGSNRSVKGGALLFGMRKTVEDEVSGMHILIDNDADLSVHPMQLGILIEKIVTGELEAVAGSRRELDSIALIGGSRDVRGRLFIQIWQHLLPDLAKLVTDTNRAYKAFTADSLRKILEGMRIYTFPYQIELLQACLYHKIPLGKQGIAYVDSEAASTQQGENITETYLNQIHQIIDISQRYDAIDPQDDLLQFFLNVTEEQWQEIESNPPQELSELL